MLVARVIAVLACVLLAGMPGRSWRCCGLLILTDCSEPDDDTHDNTNNNGKGGVHNNRQDIHGYIEDDW